MHISTNASITKSATPWPANAMPAGNVRVLEAHAPVFREGDAATHFYEVLDGAVRAVKIFPDGRRQIISFAFAGDIVGFGQKENYGFDCDTLGAARIRAIPRSSLMRALREQPELGEKLLEVAAGEVASMRDLSMLLCRKTALERIASFLLSMAARGKGPVTGVRLPLPMGRADIADYLGLTIETVSRNLTKLRSLAIIDLPGRGGFVVRDLARLQLLAECEENLH